MNAEQVFNEAFSTRDLERFLELLFPPTWKSLAARILETGAEMSDEIVPWAPRWSPLSPILRRGRTKLQTEMKSCIFRVHDCLHQLWGLPIPALGHSEDDFYLYKRAQMCGEVAVLTLTEFVFCEHLWETHPELRGYLGERNALAMKKGPLRGKSTLQIALRLDDLLHKKRRPKWVRDHAPSLAFVEDYVPMLERDRNEIDKNWAVMKAAGWRPEGAPDARYSRNLDGLELTAWMITDFYHQMETGAEVDLALRLFNMERRRGIVLPEGWGM